MISGTPWIFGASSGFAYFEGLKQRFRFLLFCQEWSIDLGFVHFAISSSRD